VVLIHAGSFSVLRQLAEADQDDVSVGRALVHVVLISENYLFDPPGLRTLVRKHRTALERRGHSVNVITTHNPDVSHNDPKLIEVPAIRLPGMHKTSLSFPGLGRVDSLVAKADIVQAYEPQLLGAWAAEQARRYQKPSLYVHNPHEPLTLDTVGVINQFDGVLAPQPSNSDALPRAGVSVPVYPIVYGYEPSSELVDPFALHRTVGLALDVPALLYVGPLENQANVPLLVDSVVSVEHPAHLFIVGDGSARHTIEQHVFARGAQQRVHVLPTQGRDSRAVQGSATLTLSASTDPHPTSIIEAAACGVPSIAVRTPHMEQAIRNRVTGIVCLPTRTSLARAVTQLLYRPALRHRYGQAAKTHAATYSLEHSIDQMLDVYAIQRRLHHVEG